MLKNGVSKELAEAVTMDVFNVMLDVYKNYWRFDEVADYILLNYVILGQIDDFKTYKELKNYIVQLFKENLQNYLKGGLK
jgi:hypothetical protein